MLYACAWQPGGSGNACCMDVAGVWEHECMLYACVRRVGASVCIECAWQARGAEYACFVHVAGVWERPSGSARCMMLVGKKVSPIKPFLPRVLSSSIIASIDNE